MKRAFAGLIAIAMIAPALAQTPPLRPDRLRFRALYKEMVETDTSITTGSCTALADKIEGHLRAAGYTADQITRSIIPGRAGSSSSCPAPRKRSSRCCCSAISTWSSPSARIGRAIPTR